MKLDYLGITLSGRVKIGSTVVPCMMKGLLDVTALLVEWQVMKKLTISTLKGEGGLS